MQTYAIDNPSIDFSTTMQNNPKNKTLIVTYTEYAQLSVSFGMQNEKCQIQMACGKHSVTVVCFGEERFSFGEMEKLLTSDIKLKLTNKCCGSMLWMLMLLGLKKLVYFKEMAERVQSVSSRVEILGSTVVFLSKITGQSAPRLLYSINGLEGLQICPNKQNNPKDVQSLSQDQLPFDLRVLDEEKTWKDWYTKNFKKDEPVTHIIPLPNKKEEDKNNDLVDKTHKHNEQPVPVVTTKDVDKSGQKGQDKTTLEVPKKKTPEPWYMLLIKIGVPIIIIVGLGVFVVREYSSSKDDLSDSEYIGRHKSGDDDWDYFEDDDEDYY